jgi:hypothetical protein
VQHVALHEGLFPGILIGKIEVFTAGGSDISKLLELKEQAENIKQLLMGKFKTTVNEE